MDIINPYIHGGEDVAFDGFGNRSRSFDGVDDTVNLGQTTDNAIFTASTWLKLKTHNSSTGEGVFGKWQTAAGGSWLIYVDAINIRFIVRNGANNAHVIVDSGISASSIIGDWTHIAGVADGTNLTLYVNGVIAASIAYDGTINNPTSDTNIGAYNNTINNLHLTDGNIADCRLYDTDLTASQISDLYNGTNITTNLVGHWLKDADNVLDAAGTNHGTNYGSKYSYDNPSPPVEFGSASRLFDGVNDKVNLGDSDDFSFDNAADDSPLSFSVWFKSNLSVGNLQTLLAKATSSTSVEYLLTINSVGGVDLVFHKNAASFGSYIVGTGSTAYIPNQWTHVVATYDGGLLDTGIKVYINGVDDTGTPISGGAYDGQSNTTADLLIGNRNTSSGQEMSGKMADVRIYDSALTAAQVSDLYAGTDVQTNLVGHYLTDNDDVEDKAGTNDGTNFGSVYSIDNPPLPLVPSRQASRNFDGVDDRVIISPNSINGATALTVSAWIKLDSIDINQTVIGILPLINTNAFRLMVRDTNQIDLIWGDGSNFFVSTLDGVVLTSGSWIHVAGTFNNSGNATRYVDGAQTGTIDDLSSYGSLSITDDVGIGARYRPSAPTYNLPLDGKIADVRIYDAELTASQILDIYNGTTDRTNLVGQWLTNSDDVLDHAGTNDGTNFGSTYSTDSPS